MKNSRRLNVSDLIEKKFLMIGDGYRAKNDELSNEGLPFARAGNINNGFHFKNADRFPEKRLSVVGNKLSQAGDVVFTSKGTVGRFAFVTPDVEQFIYSPQLCFWRSLNHDVIDPRFLYYWMNSFDFYEQFKGVSGQTDMAEYVSLTDQRRMMITLPDIATQRSIGISLGALDQKIEINKLLNSNFEKMALFIFRDWFIDFGPTRAKMVGRAPYLVADVWSAFPETMNSQGIPAGWAMSPLSNVVEISPTESLKKDALAPYLDMASLPTAGPAHKAPIMRAFSAGTKFRNGDTLLARITPCLENGKTAYVWGLGDNEVGWGSTEFIVMRSKPGVPLPFSYLVARHPEFRSHAIKSMSGTSGRQRADTNAIANYQIPLPHEKKLWPALEKTLNPLFESIIRNFRESIELSAIRDLVLPKLMSGELRVKDTEIIVRKTV